MKVIVTGGRGYLGKHVVEHFRADDFSRRSGYDILNQQDLDIIGDYDLVIHLAAKLDKNPDNAEEVFETNVTGTINVIKAMKESAVLIFASTKDVYGRFADNKNLVDESCETIFSGQSALEWSKLIAERYVEYYGSLKNIRTCIFRLSTVYAKNSPGNTPNFVGHFADCFNTGEPIHAAHAEVAVRDFLHVDDFSEACLAFYESVIRNGLYNLGGGFDNTRSLRELYELMEEVSGYQTRLVESDVGPRPIPMKYITDLSRVTQELDWSPKIGLEEGLKSLFR